MSENEIPPENKNFVRHFDARDLGLSLREVAVDVLRQESQEVESHWFHSNKDADLFLWKEGGRIIKQQVTYYGQLVEWNVAEGVRTGLIIDDDANPTMKGSHLIRFDVEPQRHAVEQGAEIIGHVRGLSAADREVLIYNLLGTRIPRRAYAAMRWVGFVRYSDFLAFFGNPSSIEE